MNLKHDTSFRLDQFFERLIPRAKYMQLSLLQLFLIACYGSHGFFSFGQKCDFPWFLVTNWRENK